MTQIRAKTLELLDSLSDEKLIYVFNILQNLEAFSRSEERQDKCDIALLAILGYSKSAFHISSVVSSNTYSFADAESLTSILTVFIKSGSGGYEEWFAYLP